MNATCIKLCTKIIKCKYSGVFLLFFFFFNSNNMPALTSFCRLRLTPDTAVYVVFKRSRFGLHVLIICVRLMKYDIIIRWNPLARSIGHNKSRMEMVNVRLLSFFPPTFPYTIITRFRVFFKYHKK